MSVSIRQMRCDATRRLVSKEKSKGKDWKKSLSLHSPFSLPFAQLSELSFSITNVCEERGGNSFDDKRFRPARYFHEEIDERKERDAFLIL